MMNAGIYRIIFMALLLFGLFGCSSEETVTQKTSGPVPSASESTVTISPLNATARAVLTMHADASLLASASIDWYVNGEIEESRGDSYFESESLKKGDIVQVVLSSDNDVYKSDEIVIRNTPPRIKSAKMVPALPKTGETIRTETAANDVDGDTIYYKYKWRVNGAYISDQKFLNTDLKRGDMIVLELTPHDSDDAGNTVFLKNRVYNSLPVVSGNEPVFDGKTYSYNLRAVDPDGDELTYEIKEGPEGMTIDRYGKVTWNVSADHAGTHKYTIVVSDNYGGEVLVPINTTIGFKE